MLSKKFINKLLTLAILSICSSVVNASDNSVPVVKLKDNFVINKVNYFSVIDNNSNNSTSDSNKSSPRSTKCNESEKMSDKRIKYNPELMWFDYKALFDNTRNTMLEKSDNKSKYVRHTNFSTNTIALHALFNSDNFDSNLFDSAMSGNLFPQYSLLENFTDYIRGMYNYEELNSLSGEQLKLIGLNYELFIKMLASLGDNTNNEVANYYASFVNEFPANERILNSLNISSRINKTFNNE